MLDDHGIRPPLIAAGINLFGGPLGLLHRHVTGAIPIRRNTKDPVYLVTLQAYVAEVLQRRDLLYYVEGGRSYSGELKAPKTGLLQAALQADRDDLSIVPMAIAYDLVLEDRILARQATKRRQRPFAQELAEMVALRRRLSVARLRDVRRADAARRTSTRSRGARSWTSRIDVQDADRSALQGAADGARRGRDAAVQMPGASSTIGSRFSSTSSAPRRRNLGVGVGGRGGRRRRGTARRTRGARRRARRQDSRPRADASAALLRAHHPAPVHAAPGSRPERTDARRAPHARHSSTPRGQPHPQDARVALRHAPARQLRPPVHRRRRRSTKRSAPRGRSKREGLRTTLDFLGESVADLRRGRRAPRASTLE